MKKSLSTCALVALSAGLAAQASTTIPKGYDKTEGQSSMAIPLMYAPSRVQCGYGPTAVPWNQAKLVKELWVRADKSAYLTRAFADFSLQVKLSSRGCDPTTRSKVFATNHGTDVKTFMAKKAYKFAAFRLSTTSPRPWTIQLKGDAPFVATTPNLLVDWAAYTQGGRTRVNNRFVVDTVKLRFGGTGKGGNFWHYGTPCNPKNFFNVSKGINVGEEFYNLGYTQNIGDYVMTWLGSTKTNIVIPGLAGCRFYTTPVVMHPKIIRTAHRSGASKFVWGKVPAFMNLQTVYSQMAAIDSRLQKMRFSRGEGIRFGNFKKTWPSLVSYQLNYAFGTRGFDPDKGNGIANMVGTAIIFDVR